MQVCTVELTAKVIAHNGLLVNFVRNILLNVSLPANTVHFGAMSFVTWVEKRILSYLNFKEGDFEVAFFGWIHGINRECCFHQASMNPITSPCCRAG